MRKEFFVFITASVLVLTIFLCEKESVTVENKAKHEVTGSYPKAPFIIAKLVY